MEYKFKEYRKSELMRNHLHLGGVNPQGESIDVTSLYIERGGKPWIGTVGEYHFVRGRREDWYSELCKMKAGGISVVSTYIFWIYHEEMEGKFDFSGDRDLRAFIKETQRVGLDVIIRIGPWAHGECRNGGFPDWLLQKPYKLREDNEEYLEKVHMWFEKIYEQVQRLFYKDGGNIIAVQLENELTDDAGHLLTLKKIAREIGFDVPLYTVTGWNSEYGAKIPVDDVIPVFGGYPEAPWEGTIEKLPLSEHYVFNKNRNDSIIGEDFIKKTDDDNWRLPYERYPFATCELGGGIQVTHHRRPMISGMDIYALSLVKLGSGNNLVGYYMYHGGTNKTGVLSTLNETKESGYPNDYPTISYDFQAPISEYGEIREQYRLINMLHMFVNDFGQVLAPMEHAEAEKKVLPDDLESLRYGMRTNGYSGFVFINHYQRLANLADIRGAVINTGNVVFPPIDVCGDISFFMPFHMDLSGEELVYATVQPLCCIDNTFFFAEIDGIAPNYKFRNGIEFTAQAGFDSARDVNGIKIVTLTYHEARYARKLNGDLYIGNDCDLYYADNEVKTAQNGDFSYYKWDGTGFEQYSVKKYYEQAVLICEEVSTPPFEPEYGYELHIGGERALTWIKLSASGNNGFLSIPFEYDAAQLYVDGILMADDFYYGRSWRIPAELVYGNECYLVMSEMRDDFYREF